MSDSALGGSPSCALGSLFIRLGSLLVYVPCATLKLARQEALPSGAGAILSVETLLISGRYPVAVEAKRHSSWQVDSGGGAGSYILRFKDDDVTGISLGIINEGH